MIRIGFLAAAGLAVVVMSVGTALACDDHVGKCELEAWRSYRTGDYVTIEGSATCDAGRITVRLYDGTKFLGIADGGVRAHAAEAIASDVGAYESLSIKYSIQPR